MWRFSGDRCVNPGVYWFSMGMYALVFFVTGWRAVAGFPT